MTNERAVCEAAYEVGMKLVPLGEEAVIAYAADEAAAVRLAAAVRAASPDWLHDVVPAYASVGVFFDADRTDAAAVMKWLRASDRRKTSDATAGAPPRTHSIPVCYTLGPDLAHVAAHANIDADAVIRLHAAPTYTVHAIGFVPGFPYLGYLPPELCGVPRLDTPRVRVEPGSVGLTGRQTGVYPLARPGGWSLIGRTPLTLVDVADGYFPLRVGDSVTFAPIDEAEFRRLSGERLPG